MAYVPPTPVRKRVAREGTVSTPRLEPVTYNISIPRGCDHDIRYPVSTCDFKINANNASKRGNMRTHFARRHLEDTITIQEVPLASMRVLRTFFKDSIV